MTGINKNSLWCSTELYCDPVLFSIFIKTLDYRRVNMLTKSSDNMKLGEAASVWEGRIRIQNKFDILETRIKCSLVGTVWQK